MSENPIELFDMTLGHVGINAAAPDEADAFAEQFLVLMGLPKKAGNSSIFSSDLIEIMKQNGRGTHGHIGFKVNNLDQAMEFFKSRGIQFAAETIKYDEQGRCIFAYFDGEIGGFAIHLNQA